MTEPSPPDFADLCEGDFQVFLLRQVLLRYGHGDLASSPAPGRLPAIAAAHASSCETLLRTACDAWSVSFGELAFRAGIAQTDISAYVMGIAPLSWDSTKSLADALAKMVLERVKPVQAATEKKNG